MAGGAGGGIRTPTVLLPADFESESGIYRLLNNDRLFRRPLILRQLEALRGLRRFRGLFCLRVRIGEEKGKWRGRK